jgi:hypothetical protein
MQYRLWNNNYWDESDYVTHRCWDFPFVINIFGVGSRHHDFNIYMNYGWAEEVENVTIGCRYTYLF